MQDESKSLQYTPLWRVSWSSISARVKCCASRPMFTPSSGTYDRNCRVSPLRTMAKKLCSSAAGDEPVGLSGEALSFVAVDEGLAGADCAQLNTDPNTSNQHNTQM